MSLSPKDVAIRSLAGKWRKALSQSNLCGRKLPTDTYSRTAAALAHGVTENAKFLVSVLKGRTQYQQTMIMIADPARLADFKNDDGRDIIYPLADSLGVLADSVGRSSRSLGQEVSIGDQNTTIGTLIIDFIDDATERLEVVNAGYSVLVEQSSDDL